MKNYFLRSPLEYFQDIIKYNVFLPIWHSISEIPSLLLTKKDFFIRQWKVYKWSYSSFPFYWLETQNSLTHLFNFYLSYLYILFQRLFCSRYWKRNTEHDMFLWNIYSCGHGDWEEKTWSKQATKYMRKICSIEIMLWMILNKLTTLSWIFTNSGQLWKCWDQSI